MKKNTIKYLLLCVIGTATISCNKGVLDKTDLTSIPNDIWNNEASINLYLARTYDLIIPTWPIPGTIHNTSDETNSGYTALLYGQLTDNSVLDVGIKNQNTNPGGSIITSGNTQNNGDLYWSIRRCNIAIDAIEAGTLPRSTKSVLKGQFYFLRAWMYFYMVKLYGGMPLILHSQTLTDNMYVARNKTSECIQQITTDLDSCMGLPARWPSQATDGGKITRDAALAFKGKVLLYWASPQFNPNDDRARWKMAYDACKLAYTTCLADGYKLQTNFADIFTNESSNNERIIWRTIDAVTPGRGTNTEALVRPASEGGGGGGYQPTWNLVQMFPDTNGLRITDAGTVYDAEFFWRKRDPRFNATIAYNGGRWDLSGKINRRQWNYNGMLDDAGGINAISKTGFYCKKLSNPNLSATGVKYDSSIGGGSGMDWIEMRFAEVIMNYAEAANGNDMLDEAQQAVALIRARAGIVQGSFNYGINKIGIDRASMFRLIWNERAIEFAMEGKRYDDLRRTRQFTALNGTQRLAFIWAIKSPYVAGALPASPVAGKIYMDAVDATGKRIRDTININNKGVYEKFFTPSTLSLEGTGANAVINFPDNYYFYPLPSAFRTSDPILEQTLGWPGGTFDPLK